MSPRGTYMISSINPYEIQVDKPRRWGRKLTLIEQKFRSFILIDKILL